MREVAIASRANGPAGYFDRRAIPATAREWQWHAPDGHAIRAIDWPAPDAAPTCGAILFMAGRGDAYEKYLETFEHWRRRGWQVSAADWRGQAGSGRFGLDELTGHIDDFALWVADLARFWREWAERAGEGPLVLAGHSMGGHLVLRAAAERALEPRPAALILSAPMLDVHPEPVPQAVRHLVARAMLLMGDKRRMAWKYNEKPGLLPAARQLLLTHDEARYADELWWRAERPELAMGPGSWGWVESALRSIRALERPGVLEALDLPVLLLATRADRLVGIRATERAAARLPRAEALFFGPEARHEILREVDAVRDRALAAIDAFLARICAADAGKRS
jgi:lysophospholipase